MDSARYTPSNPGSWNLLDRLARDILFLDLSNTSWFNITLSDARGRLNMQSDTVLTFPDFSKTQRHYTFQSYSPIAKSKYPKETIVTYRQHSSHYELQKMVPPVEQEEDGLQGWRAPFTRGFLLQIGQNGKNPIDSDFLIRITEKSRLTMRTTPPEKKNRSHINDVLLMYQLDTDKTSYEMGFSTANELSLRLIRLLQPTLVLACDLYSKHYPPSRSENSAPSVSKGTTISRASIGARWTNVAMDGSPIANTVTSVPLEASAYASIGQHYGFSIGTRLLDNKLGIAINWRKRWSRRGEQRVDIGLLYHFLLNDTPSFMKIRLSNYAGIAAFFGVRLSGVFGVGVGASFDHHNHIPRAGLFFNI